jgi:ABC-2 type transport system permease protein
VLLGDSYLEFATAGILLQNAFGSALQSGTSIVLDIDSGDLQKMLVAPVKRSAILLGRLASDAFRVVVQSAIILGLAYALGVFVTILDLSESCSCSSVLLGPKFL